MASEPPDCVFDRQRIDNRVVGTGRGSECGDEARVHVNRGLGLGVLGHPTAGGFYADLKAANIDRVPTKVFDLSPSKAGSKRQQEDSKGHRVLGMEGFGGVP